MEATLNQKRGPGREAGYFPRKHDQDALRQAYQAFRASDGGSDGDFAALHGVPIQSLRRFLAQWRAAHLIEGRQAENFDLETGKFGEFQATPSGGSFSELRATARKVVSRIMKGDKVSQQQAKMAEQILKSDFKDEAQRDKVSEFEAMSDEQLAELVSGALGMPYNTYSRAQAANAAQAPVNQPQAVESPDHQHLAQDHGTTPGAPTNPGALDAPPPAADEQTDSNAGQPRA
jgi:hypothetical protein